MTNDEKRELREYCKRGYDFKKIRGLVYCSDSTIKNYMEAFSQPTNLNNQTERE